MLRRRHDSRCGLTKPRHPVGLSMMRHYRTMTHRAPSLQLDHLTQLSPLNQTNCVGRVSWWTSLSSDDPAQVYSSVHSCASLSSSSATEQSVRTINRRSERWNHNLVVPFAGRHAHCADSTQLNFGVLNVCSLGNKVEAVKTLIDDHKIVMCLNKTLHEDSDSPPIRRLRAHGFQVLERARPISSNNIASGRLC